MYTWRVVEKMRQAGTPYIAMASNYAIFASIDIASVDATAGTIVGAIVNAKNAGVILSPSVIMWSQHSVVMLWLLASCNGQAGDEMDYDMPLFEELQRKILQQFSVIEPDVHDRDVAKIAQSNALFGFSRILAVNDDIGNVVVFTLTELANWLQGCRDNRETKTIGDIVKQNIETLNKTRLHLASFWTTR